MKKIMLSLAALAAFGAAGAAAEVGEETVSLVENGAPTACLVVPDGAPEYQKTAAAELVRWTKLLTGAEIPIVSAAQAGLKPITYVELPADEKTVKHDGFRITASEKGIEIASKRPYGIVFSSYWILNRRGGMYWCDAESGTDFTPRKDLTVAKGVTLRNPLPDRARVAPGFAPKGKGHLLGEWHMRNGLPPTDCPKETAWTRKWGVTPQARINGALGMRVYSSVTNEDEIAAEIKRMKAAGEDKKYCRNDSPSTIRRLAQHNLSFKRYPERYPIVNGKRVRTGALWDTKNLPGTVANCCITHPSTRQHILEGMLAERAALGKDTRVMYSIMDDDISQWCECELCAPLCTSIGNSSKDDRTSDLWWDFINWITPRLLKDDPNAIVEIGIYLTYRQPPKKVKAENCDPTRTRVLVCPHGRCYLHALNDPTCKTNKRYREMLAVWGDLGFNVDTFEYHSQLPGKGNYAFIEKAWVDDLKWYHERGISHTSGGLWGVWWGYDGAKGLEEQLIYRYGAKARWQIINLSAHFMWDKDDDFETERRKLLTAYYRAAAPEMLEYHALLEQAIMAPNICMSYGSSAMPFTVAASDPALVAKAKDLLKRADEHAGKDTELKRRIERDRQNFYRDWEGAAQLAAATKARRLFAATDPIKIDGVLDEKTWKSATLSDDFRWGKTYNVDAAQTDPLDPHTSYRIAFDTTNLYLAVLCEKSNGKVKDVPGKGGTWDAMEGSHLQFCLLAPGLNGDYYHFALSHNGKRYSALTTNSTLRDLNKKLAFTYGIKDEPTRWTAEIAIPLAQIGLPKEGELWRLCVFRQCVGPDGYMRYGISTGFPLHWIDRWESYSFGVSGTIALNGSFERGAPHPRDQKWNGKSWIFRQEEAPAQWRYHPNGGDLDWCAGDAADGLRYVRVRPVRNLTGPEFLELHQFPLYPPGTKELKVRFAARGKGEIRVFAFNLKKLKPVELKLDSPDAWTYFDFTMPVEGIRPYNLVWRLNAPEKGPIDLDDVSILPIR